jgi:SAM-dependent methyltransferase
MRSAFRSWGTPCDAIDPEPGDRSVLERPGVGSPRVNVQESAARYAFAANMANTTGGARVLDVASGAGLGSELLRRRGAGFVVGVEADADAVAAHGVAADSFGPSFVRADATALPFVDGWCDLVVSFETIEHVVDASRMLAECRRMLRPGGRLVLSTPNRTVTRWLAPNPFHVREFTTREIVTLVRQHFTDVTCHWQRPVVVPVFAFRQIVRRRLALAPGGQRAWRLWQRIRPERANLGATIWRGERFDDELLNDAYYHVAPPPRMSWYRPMYTVLVARC